MKPKKKWSLRRHGMELRKHFPADKPVKIRRVALDCLGDVADCGGHYLIRIRGTAPLREQKETLWHEWAHVLAGWTDTHQHTKKWGAYYARIYKHMQDEI